MKSKSTILRMTNLAMCIAIGSVLEILASTFRLGQGGSISLIILPIILIAYRYSIVDGIICGISSSIIDGLFTSFYIINFWQFMLDYILPFALLALSVVPIKRKAINNSNLWFVSRLVIGITVAFFLRYCCHVISGIIFFGENALDKSVITFSLAYNATYLLPAYLVSVIVTPIVFMSIKDKQFYKK